MIKSISGLIKVKKWNKHTGKFYLEKFLLDFLIKRIEYMKYINELSIYSHLDKSAFIPLKLILMFLSFQFVEMRKENKKNSF